MTGGNIITESNNVTFVGDTASFTNSSTAKHKKDHFTITASSGAFSGSFPIPDGHTTKSLSFDGVILQNQGLGYGWFLGTSQGGIVQLQPLFPYAGACSEFARKIACAHYPDWMRRVYVLVLLVIFAGCCGLFAESAADAIARATAMREAGDFKGAADILGAAMKSPQLSPVQQKDLSLQLDMLRRLKLDYSLSRDELYNDLTGAVKDLTPQEYSGWIDQGRFDSRTIDGQAQFVNTSVNNLFFRYPELRVRRIHDKNTVPEQRGRYLDCLAIQIAALQQRSPYVLPHYFLCTMTVTTHPDAVPESGKKDGELIRAWLPIPREYPYQNQFKFIRSSPPVLSLAPDTSPIRSSYLEQHAAANAGDEIFHHLQLHAVGSLF